MTLNWNKNILYIALFAFLPAAYCLLSSGYTGASETKKQVRIIYSNDTLGYLEPCGCGGRYVGGLARRATAISSLLDADPNAIILDSGNISNIDIKLAVIASLIAKMKYDAIGIGSTDRLFANEFFKQTAINKLTVIDSSRPKSLYTVPYLIKRVNGIRVGIVSYEPAISPGASDLLNTFNENYNTACKASDILILLDQGGIANTNWLDSSATKSGVPDIVIGGASRGVLAKEKIIGKTHFVPTSNLGKLLGVIDIDLSAPGAPGIAVQMISIDKNVQEDEAVKQIVEDYIAGPSSRRATAKLPAGFGALGKGLYRSPEACKECHPDEYKDWQKTRHASALNTLISKDRMIADCLPCHSEEYRQTLKTTRRQSLPTGIECATCHASVLPHGDDGPAKTAIRKVDPKLCLSCHTPERSPDYNQSKYLPKVSHSMLDINKQITK